MQGFFAIKIMNKRPSFQFYPSDWRNDTDLQLCSMEAQGVWINLICVMHESPQYGYLMAGENRNIESEIYKILGISKAKTCKIIEELLKKNVIKRDKTGVLFCKRMVNDENIRNIRADAGKKGGNPNLLKPKKEVLLGNLVNQNPNQSPTPSSSSSSSSSSSIIIEDSSTLSLVSETYEPTTTTILKFDCNGTPKEYILTDKKLAEYQDAYPTIDVLAELKSAKQWTIDNNKKTASGMPRFLNAWLARSNNRQPTKKQNEKTRPTINRNEGTCNESIDFSMYNLATKRNG